MPDLQITIGERTFEVACQKGEEHFLKSAAALLNNEASALTEQIGRLPESRMLLMAGLMLADKTASVEDSIAEMQSKLDERDAEIEGLKNTPAAEPTRVEVPVVPQEVTDTLAELAARAEALASEIEEKAAS